MRIGRRDRTDRDMPFSTKTLVRFTAKLSRCLSLALLPALASEVHAVSQPQRKQNVRSAQPGSASKAGSQPYLAALGPLPLRFARPGPEPAEEPPAPPEPKIVVVLDAGPTSDNKPEKSPDEKAADVTTAPLGEALPRQPDHTAEPLSEFSEPSLQPPLPILPDDTKRELRAEDVLPFFIYPTAAPVSGEGGVQVIVPLNNGQTQSNPLPPSSATYQLK
jgi:hypothetical protein